MTKQQYLDYFFGSYSLVSVLSNKNGCSVLRVRNKELGRDLIVRSFDEPIAAYDELYGINCENLPLIFDSLIFDDGQIILEEYIEGITVAEVMESGKYRKNGAKRVLFGVLSALSVLHSRGLVHRDIKPENIIIDRNGRIVLIDFNAARQLKTAQKDTIIMGTIGYASPEQLGITQSDQRTDIYAAGVLLNVMLTGVHPSEKLARGRIGRIVRKCTAISPDERYQTAKELLAAL